MSGQREHPYLLDVVLGIEYMCRKDLGDSLNFREFCSFRKRDLRLDGAPGYSTEELPVLLYKQVQCTQF
jgi:hypothetical protein